MINRLYIILILIIFCLLSMNFAQSKGGRWQFENNGGDSADWDNQEDSGVLQGQASFAASDPLKEGDSYLYLDTTSVHDFFKIMDSEDLDFDNENIGISAWIYPIRLNDVHYIVNKGVQDTNPKTTNYALRISLTENLEFLIRDVNNQAKRATSSFNIMINEWNFVAIYYDYETKKVYMWNTPSLTAIDTVDFSFDFFSNGDPLVIGSWFRNDTSSPSIKDFKGRIDDVRISGRIENIIPATTRIDNINSKLVENNKKELNIYPNPANSSDNNVSINYKSTKSENEPVEVRIYNILGQIVYHTRIINRNNNKLYTWNFRDGMGNLVNTGVYFVRISGPETRITKRLLFFK